MRRVRVHQVPLLRSGPLAIVAVLKVPSRHSVQDVQEEGIVGVNGQGSGKERECVCKWEREERETQMKEKTGRLSAQMGVICSCNIVLCSAFFFFFFFFTFFFFSFFLLLF